MKNFIIGLCDISAGTLYFHCITDAINEKAAMYDFCVNSGFNIDPNLDTPEYTISYFQDIAFDHGFVLNIMEV